MYGSPAAEPSKFLTYTRFKGKAAGKVDFHASQKSIKGCEDSSKPIVLEFERTTLILPASAPKSY